MNHLAYTGYGKVAPAPCKTEVGGGSEGLRCGVSPGFKMRVPLFAEYADKKVRIGVASMRGNSSADFKLTLPEEPKHILLNLNFDVLTDKEEVKMMK